MCVSMCVFMCVRLYVCLCLYAHAHTNAHRFIVESLVFVNLINGVKHDTKGLFVTGTALCTSRSMQFVVWSCTARKCEVAITFWAMFQYVQKHPRCF